MRELIVDMKNDSELIVRFSFFFLENLKRYCRV